MSSISKAQKVLIWFSAYPGMSFTAEEIAFKFDIPHCDVSVTLRGLVGKGLLAREKRGRNRRTTHYVAGPVLLDLI